MSSMTPVLKHPPIEEVVCGFIFDPLPLDSMLFGLYWQERRTDYPRHLLQPPLIEEASTIDILQARAWLVSGEDDFILQLQFDRFYMNWRRRTALYPGFVERGSIPGLKSRAIQEFEKFKNFCLREVHLAPSLFRVELAKISKLKKGIHYSDVADLGKILKAARIFEDISAGIAPQLQLHLRETRTEDSDAVNIGIIVGPDTVRIETRMSFVPIEIDEQLIRANDTLNNIFFGLMNIDELHRFNRAFEEEKL